MPKIAVYTCAIGAHDWIHRAQVRPADVDFLRFSNEKPWRRMGWIHCALPPFSEAYTPRVLSRFPKLCPQEVLTGYDIGVWVDASIEIMGDITPLIEEFTQSGADLALFPHPSGRSVGEEFDFAIEAGRIGPEFYDAAERQKQRYAEMGLLDRKVVEASIIFYRLSSDTLRAAGADWWHELTHYTERDQVSQPYAMRDAQLHIHLWDWHFKQENPNFRRHPHRPKTFIKRLKTGALRLSDTRFEYRLVRYGMQAVSTLKHAGSALLSRS